jgi:hypothetical protein
VTVRVKKTSKIKTMFFWAQNSVRDVTIPTPIPFDFGTDGFGIVASPN